MNRQQGDGEFVEKSRVGSLSPGVRKLSVQWKFCVNTDSSRQCQVHRE